MSDDITMRLRREIMSLIADEAADTIEQLRKERDEARREICDWVSEGREDPKAIAARYRWDCFKEDAK